MKQKYKILIVEDDDDLRLDMRNSFVDDFEIFLASEGVGAIKILVDNDVDLIITDYKMDILGGMLWVKFLNKFCKDIKVIITSGFLSADNRSSIPYPIVYKPFTYEGLKEKIIEQLEEK